ncbi:APC family permease [Conexibacter woesei]|uniref:APC family permease n=1 Tax=Conexibacter woesei TaxID=191495 RepID=UPI000421CDF2|nr:APC family permease [Conexibacter woesei]
MTSIATTTSSEPPTPPTGGGGDHHDGHYKQELHRALNVLGNVAITVSAITPASSVFIIIPVLLVTVGSATFLALAIAAFIGAAMSLCWAELGAAYPIAGGDYAIINRVLGRAAGFVSLVLTGPVAAAFIPAVIALGMAQYLSVVFSMDAKTLAAIVIALATVVAVFGIRFNAVVTGIFLSCELLALLVVSALGLIHIQQPVSELFSPHVWDATGHATTVSLSMILSGVAIAIFAYNGYANALNFVEETEGPSKGIAKAILWSLTIAVVFELVPITLALLGTPSLAAFTNDASPMQYLMTTLGSKTLNDIISLAIAAAILNAVIAILLQCARIMWSSGRDRAWPGPVNKVFCAVHPQLKTPWLATIVVGAVGVILVLTVDVVTLSTWTGVTLAIDYAMIALAAILSRVRRPDLDRPYRMPLWPVAPIVGLVGCCVILYEQAWKDLRVGIIIVVVSLLYYGVFLHPRRKTHWLILNATSDQG